MKIRIEKETKWNQFDKQMHTNYFVWVNGRCTACAKTEEEARNMVDEIKASYTAPSHETIYEEEI
jgi:hypothetical protein